MSILPIGLIGGGGSAQPSPSQTNSTANTGSENKPANAAAGDQTAQSASSPKETKNEISQPATASQNSQAVRGEGPSSLTTRLGSATSLDAAVDALSEARARAEKVVGELRTQGLIESIASRPDVADITGAAASQKAEAAFEQVRQIDATYGGSGAETDMAETT